MSLEKLGTAVITAVITAIITASGTFITTAYLAKKPNFQLPSDVRLDDLVDLMILNIGEETEISGIKFKVGQLELEQNTVKSLVVENSRGHRLAQAERVGVGYSFFVNEDVVTGCIFRIDTLYSPDLLAQNKIAITWQQKDYPGKSCKPERFKPNPTVPFETGSHRAIEPVTSVRQNERYA